MSRHTWSTHYSAAVLAGVAALAAAGAALTGLVDNRGELLLAVAAVVLAGIAVHVAVLRPRLAADATGVTVRGWSGSHTWPWSSLRAEVRHTRRLGRRAAALELDGLDTDGVERLVVLGRLDLGADPEDVSATLTAMRHELAG